LGVLSAAYHNGTGDERAATKISGGYAARPVLANIVIQCMQPKTKDGNPCRSQAAAHLPGSTSHLWAVVPWAAIGSAFALVETALGCQAVGMRTYGQYCPIARASELLAERWSFIILRNIVLIVCRNFN
jgi:hypothetical protein